MGIVVLANADQKDSAEFDIIHRIIEDFLDLERKTPGTRYISSDSLSVSFAKNATGRSISTRPLTLSLEHYAGTYISPGYPNITFCTPSSRSIDCKDVIKQFQLFEDVSISSTLYARIPSLWISYGRLRWKEGNSFALSGTNLFPHGYGSDESPFETWEAGEATAEFVVEQADSTGNLSSGIPRVLGLGIMDLSGEVTERSRLPGGIKERAEIWFTKV